MMTFHRPSSDPYYSKLSFGLFSPFAVLYSLLGNLLVRSRPLPPLTPIATPRVAIVTGSNTGIGLETAKGLVEAGYTVVLACRSRDKALAAVERLAQGPGQAVFVHPLDLSDATSISAFCAAVKARYPIIHVLVNNAGRNTSGNVGGRDLLFQSNFVGHYQLTAQLMECLCKSPSPIIVNLSSVMHHFNRGKLLDSVEFWKLAADAEAEPRDTYSLSKLAAILFSMELNRRYPGRIRSIAVNPGAVNSDIWRDFPRVLIPLFGLIYLTPAQGSRTSLVAALEADTLPSTAVYLQPYWQPSTATPFPLLEMLGPFVGCAVVEPRLPADPVPAGKALWRAGQELTGVQWP